MKTFLNNIFLTFIWTTLTMRLDFQNLMFGFVLSYLILWFMQRNNRTDKYFSFFPKLISFLLLFLKEVVVGSVKIAYDIVTPKHFMNPGILAVPLDAKTDLEITLLANAITLTPGTTSLAVSKDKKTLYVYNVYVDKNDKQKSIDAIKNGLEKKLLEALR
jgi:multicomponent Na+:H+ antiporter subunit E